jgi:hypothetical protein
VDGGLDYDGEDYESRDTFDHSLEVFGGLHWDWFAQGSDLEASLDARPFISLAVSADAWRSMATCGTTYSATCIGPSTSTKNSTAIRLTIAREAISACPSHWDGHSEWRGGS